MKILLVMFLMLLPALAGAQVAPKATLSQEDMGICDPLRFGSARTDATLATAIASTGSASRPDCSGSKFLLIPAGAPWVISANLTVPSRMKLLVPAGGRVQIQSGITLQANGCWEAGDYQIFQGPGLVRSVNSCGIYNPTHWGADSTGVSLSSPMIQSAIDAAGLAGGGLVKLKAGNYSTDTIFMRSSVALDGMGIGATKLNFIGHSTSHNSMVLMGDRGTSHNNPPQIGVGRITNSAIRHMTLNGNRNLQIAAGDEFSSCVMIWGSDENIVEHVEMHDCQGDGIFVGFLTVERPEPANRNIIQHNKIYSMRRWSLAMTNGNENKILYNRSAGGFDFEIDPGPPATIKKNLIHGNTGIDGANEASGFLISLGTLTPETYTYFGNMITNNVLQEFFGQQNSSTIITGNTFIGSNSITTSLMRLWGFYDAVVCNNIFKANSAVSTGLTAILDVRAGANLRICDNIVHNESLPFAYFTGSFFQHNYGWGHIYSGNILTGIGPYHGAANGPERIGEVATFRMTVSGGSPNIVGLFQMSGVPLYPSGTCNGDINAGFQCGRIAFSGSGVILVVNFPSGGIFYQIEALPYGNFGSTTEPYLHHVVMQLDENLAAAPWHRATSFFLSPMTTGPSNYSQVSFADNSGTPATVFFRITY